MPGLPPPRHIPTLPSTVILRLPSSTAAAPRGRPAPGPPIDRTQHRLGEEGVSGDWSPRTERAENDTTPPRRQMRRATMRAVWYDRQGSADEVLVCGELPTPEAGHGEVRVRLEASGVNPSDTYRRRGPPAMEYPRVVTNSDGAGRVDQVGPGVFPALARQARLALQRSAQRPLDGYRGGIHCALGRSGERTSRPRLVRRGSDPGRAGDDSSVAII
jgi:hypothetical protein